MNARDNLKPKSIRVAILQALSDGAITTIDDLQIKMDEGRTKIAQNIYPAAAEGLVKRMRDDVTNQAAYQITAKGRELLAKYASGKADAPADVVDAVAVEKSVITPGVKVGPVVLDHIENLNKQIEQLGNEKDAEIAQLGADVSRLERLFLSACQDLALISVRLGLDSEEGGANPILNAIDQLERSHDPVGYVLNRPGQPMKRFSKAETAKARALSFARGYGIRSQAKVFALHLVGTAVPGSEWRKA